MMLVKILEFGSNWWARFGREANDPWRFTRRAAYYNSAGLRCGRNIRRRWLVPGLVRFNGRSDFDPHFPLRSIGKTFCCQGLTLSPHGNRLLLEHRTVITDSPDYFLAVISSDRHGFIDFSDTESKSETAVPIAVSEFRDKQEVLILLRPKAWVRSSIGFWQLVSQPGTSNAASLQLAESTYGI